MQICQIIEIFHTLIKPKMKYVIAICISINVKHIPAAKLQKQPEKAQTQNTKIFTCVYLNKYS